MRIITGLLKGRKINISSTSKVRPTTDRVKEGLFSVIESHRYLQHSTILDLFAGSGNLGFEALSRGAESVLFVDHNKHNINHIEQQAKTFNMTDQANTIKLDVQKFLAGPPTPADIIFSDPPYKYPHIEETVQTILSDGWLRPEGWLVLEHNKYYDFSDHSNCLQVKRYGRTFVSFFNESIVNE